MQRVQELCRKLKPVLGKKVDRLWMAYLAESDAGGKADMVALARGMMYDPRWAWHAAEELGVETEYPKVYARCAPSQWPEVFPWRD